MFKCVKFLPKINRNGKEFVLFQLNQYYKNQKYTLQQIWGVNFCSELDRLQFKN